MSSECIYKTRENPKEEVSTRSTGEFRVQAPGIFSFAYSGNLRGLRPQCIHVTCVIGGMWDYREDSDSWSLEESFARPQSTCCVNQGLPEILPTYSTTLAADDRHQLQAPLNVTWSKRVPISKNPNQYSGIIEHKIATLFDYSRHLTCQAPRNGGRGAIVH